MVGNVGWLEARAFVSAQVRVRELKVAFGGEMLPDLLKERRIGREDDGIHAIPDTRGIVRRSRIVDGSRLVRIDEIVDRFLLLVRHLRTNRLASASLASVKSRGATRLALELLWAALVSAPVLATYFGEVLLALRAVERAGEDVGHILGCLSFTLIFSQKSILFNDQLPECFRQFRVLDEEPSSSSCKL